MQASYRIAVLQMGCVDLFQALLAQVRVQSKGVRRGFTAKLSASGKILGFLLIVTVE
jgi:hypothetical protein